MAGRWRKMWRGTAPIGWVAGRWQRVGRPVGTAGRGRKPGVPPEAASLVPFGNRYSGFSLLL